MRPVSIIAAKAVAKRVLTRSSSWNFGLTNATATTQHASTGATEIRQIHAIRSSFLPQGMVIGSERRQKAAEMVERQHRPLTTTILVDDAG
jgi:hypothetical protein